VPLYGPIIRMDLDVVTNHPANVHEPVKFNKISTNVGSGFTADTTTGIITVLEAGLYLIESKVDPKSATAAAQGNHDHAANNVRIGYVYIDSSLNANFPHYSECSSLKQLAAGTQIVVRVFFNYVGTIGSPGIGGCFVQVRRVG
jgi:hypothetical protein